MKQTLFMTGQQRSAGHIQRGCKGFQPQTKLGASAPVACVSCHPCFIQALSSCKLPGQQALLRLSKTPQHAKVIQSGNTQLGHSAMSQSNGTSKSFDANPLEDDGSLDLTTWIENI